MKKQLKRGMALVNKIDAAYNKLDNYNEWFFDAFHDDMRIQRDCAFMELDELEEYSNNPKKQFEFLKVSCLFYFKVINFLGANCKYMRKAKFYINPLSFGLFFLS